MMECLSCRSLSGEKRISPGPCIYEGRFWVVDHAYPTRLVGWLVIVPKRHVEALHELSREEFAELAEIQRRLSLVMRDWPGVEKEYLACFAESEGFHHVHIHFIARSRDLEPALKGPRIFALLAEDEAQAAPADAIREFSRTFAEKLRAVE